MTQDAQAPHSSGRTKLLLVEPDESVGVSIGQLLPRDDSSPFEIWSLPGVEEALRLLQEERFDALVLDLDAGEDPGIDALLRARIATASLPVVVVSNDEDETLALRTLRLGAQDYIVRREASAQLVTRTIRHALERHQLVRELTETRQREHFLATHDALTELPNRFYLEEFMARSIELAKRRDSTVGAVFIDLDGFKAVNDTLGHATGDELLRQAAQRLLAAVRRTDLVCRLGGDEFVLALPDVAGVDELHAHAEKVSHALSQPFRIGGQDCFVSGSLGIARFPDDAADADELIRCADVAMYEAKRRGPNKIRAHQQNSENELTGRFQLVNGLRVAIERDELRMHYQPQIDTLSGAAVSVEAFPRWQHRSEGWVSPGVFIPVAEQSGMMIPIGEWVLQRACRDALGWPQPLRVTVNISSVQLAEADFAQRVVAILEDSGLPAERLELEIVEPCHSSDRQMLTEHLVALRAAGVRIALDDFGTGASSLSLLRSLPLDAVKLDELLVHGSAEDPRTQLIIGSLVKLTRGLGLDLVAEGVESAEQLRLLHAQGCRRVQGYLLGKPTPASDFAALLEEAAWERELASLSG